MKLWDVASGRELASLFSLDRSDWAVVDPQGRFDASPGGMHLMHWVVGMEPIDFTQLKERYYEPGLLNKVFKREPLPDVTALDTVALYPSVQVQPPALGSTKLHIRLKNRGGGIGRVQIFVNGKELLADARGSQVDPSAAEGSVTVDLNGAHVKPGEENEIRVISWNQRDRGSGSGGRPHSRAPWNLEGQGNHAKNEEREANCVYRAHARADALFISGGKNFGKSVSN
jgi:hypothetical protein